MNRIAGDAQMCMQAEHSHEKMTKMFLRFGGEVGFETGFLCIVMEPVLELAW